MYLEYENACITSSFISAVPTLSSKYNSVYPTTLSGERVFSNLNIPVVLFIKTKSLDYMVVY